jgi:hypothetical protein
MVSQVMPRKDPRDVKDSKKTRLDNGRTLQPGATPLGTATRGDGHGRFYDNNGDEVSGSTGSEWLRKNNGGG